MFICKLFIEFMIYSFFGWMYECAYCTLKEGHWSNRGFLFGPICPIYGLGCIGCELVFGVLPFFKGIPYAQIPIWKIFLICAVGSIFLEYGTSLLLEKKFHAVWWDYKDFPLNINGRVCVPATMGFGVAGIFVTRFVLPVAEGIKAAVPVPLAEIIALLLMGYLAADLVLTVSSLMQLLEMVEGAMGEFDEKMEEAFKVAAATPSKAKEAITAVPGKAKDAFLAAPGKAKEALINYEEAIRANVSKQAQRLNFRQEYELKSIKKFRFRKPTVKKNVSAEKMSDYYKRLQDRVKSDK
ncbi:putative ABC transporter permease [Butyrivibrio sp. NC2002]|uniref:putative ABC transporter permease n=1 Tax=Butyrivibrio sp. NC2002 TaxID=1410610 RepID=UPI000689AE86|nr:putative ABC transporter permease [Butyrivibrio sp. NC2002]